MADVWCPSVTFPPPVERVRCAYDASVGAPSTEKRRLVFFYAARHRVLVGVVIEDESIRASDGGLSRRWATALVQRVGDAVQAELCDPDREWDLAPKAPSSLPPAGVRVCSFEDAAPRTAPVFRCPAAARTMISESHAALVASAAAREEVLVFPSDNSGVVAAYSLPTAHAAHTVGDKPGAQSYKEAHSRLAASWAARAVLGGNVEGENVLVALRGAVYDLTRFAPDHPGSTDTLLDFAGAGPVPESSRRRRDAGRRASARRRGGRGRKVSRGRRPRRHGRLGDVRGRRPLERGPAARRDAPRGRDARRRARVRGGGAAARARRARRVVVPRLRRLRARRLAARGRPRVRRAHGRVAALVALLRRAARRPAAAEATMA